VAANYDLFGGVSPLTEITRRQASGLQARLASAGLNLPVCIGMRNWHPYLADTLREMSKAGIRKAIGFIAAAHHSYSSCQQYKENVRDARRQIVEEGCPDVAITYVDSWYDHPLFIETMARHVEDAIARLEPGLRASAGLVFTAHSLPHGLAGRSRYVEQLTLSSRRVAERVGRTDWSLVYQSRSGLPTDPWLEPDIRDHLRDRHAGGLSAAVVVPIGFVCDHIEVLFDLDTQAAALCREIGLPMVRAATVGDDPRFTDMISDVVRQTWERFRRYPVLDVTA
jgi:ferrochelatase